MARLRVATGWALVGSLAVWLGPAPAIAAITTYTGSWSGGTIAPGDTALLNDGASITGDVVASGTLQFNQTTALTMSSTLSGTGGLAVTNTGTFSLAGLTSGVGRFDLAINAASGRLNIGASGTNPLLVGNSGNGALSVSGGWVSSGTGYLGAVAGGYGTATVSSGSWTTNTKVLFVGYTGTGGLVVTGGTVANSSGVVGYPGGVGSASISGGAWKNGGALYIGGYTSGSGVGTGTLTVAGGQITDTIGYLGFGAGNVGTAIVSGGTWTNSANLYIGSSGSGTLRMTGGMLTSASGTIASTASGVGTAIVSGGTWSNTGSLVVGGSGTGMLTISGSGGTGGVVIVGGTLSRGGSGTIQLGAGGMLQIGIGSATGGLGTDLVNDGALVFNRAGSAVVSNSISGTGSLTLAGSGSLTFSGTNTHSGPTAVNAGALVVTGALGATAVSVNAGGLLTGSGSIAGPVTVGAGGTLMPGPGIESLSTGALTLVNGAAFAYSVASSGSAGPTADLVRVAGDFAISGSAGLAITDVSGTTVAFADGTTFSLVNYTGTWNQGLLTWAGTALADGAIFTFADRLWAIDYDASSGGTNFFGEYLPGGRFLTMTAVPEPATGALLLAGAACGGWALRRRGAAGRRAGRRPRPLPPPRAGHAAADRCPSVS